MLTLNPLRCKGFLLRLNTSYLVILGFGITGAIGIIIMFISLALNLNKSI
jgi:hypothetical protein